MRLKVAVVVNFYHKVCTLNNRVYHRLLVAWFLLLGTAPQVCRGTEYRTDRLALMARLVGSPDGIDTLCAPIFKGRVLTVTVDSGRVSHIGYCLFSSKQREAFGTTVCNFIERYLLELDLPIMPEISRQERMSIDRVTIIGHADVAALCADTTVSIHTQVIYEKGYTMSWQREGRQLCSITFPVEYNLLIGVDMEERERRLPLELARFSSAPQPQIPLCDSLPPLQLRKSWNDNYYTLHGGHYLLESLSANSYYSKDTLGHLLPIFSRQLPVESLANLFVIGTIEGDFRMQVKLRKYGFKTDTLSTTPAQWLAFCRDEGCTPFFGLISMDDKQADCELIMHCPDKGFNHVMRMKIPLDIISSHMGQLEARLNAYVTSSRIKNLFEDYTK